MMVCFCVYLSSCVLVISTIWKTQDNLLNPIRNTSCKNSQVWVSGKLTFHDLKEDTVSKWFTSFPQFHLDFSSSAYSTISVLFFFFFLIKKKNLYYTVAVPNTKPRCSFSLLFCSWLLLGRVDVDGNVCPVSSSSVGGAVPPLVLSHQLPHSADGEIFEG